MPPYWAVEPSRGSVSSLGQNGMFCAGSSLSLSFPESAGGGLGLWVSRTGLPGRLVAVSLVAVSAGTLELSLGVPGAGLRPVPAGPQPARCSPARWASAPWAPR